MPNEHHDFVMGWSLGKTFLHFLVSLHGLIVPLWLGIPDDIEIRFYEEDENGETRWEGRGEFGIPDVHRQVTIFSVPESSK